MCYNTIMEGSVMKRYVNLVVFLFLLVIIPIHGYADELLDVCDFSIKAKLKKLSSNISTSYVPVEQGNKVTFDITISNIYPNLVVIDRETGREYRYDASREIPSQITLSGYESDQTYRFEVYADKENCSEESLNIYYVTLPAFNPYYKDQLCKGIEHYKLCNKWLKHSLSHDEFIKEITAYKESLNQPKNQTEKKETENSMLAFIKEYYYIFIGLGILGIGYVIYVRRKRDSFGF